MEQQIITILNSTASKGLEGNISAISQEMKSWEMEKNAKEQFKVAVHMKHCIHQSFYKEILEQWANESNVDISKVKMKYLFQYDHDIVTYIHFD